MTKPIRIMFMGTPDFAAVLLRGLHHGGYPVCAVVTQPDRPKGRGHKMMMSPVKEFALCESIPVLQPATLRGGELTEALEEYDPEMIIVAAYGNILPEYVLDYPKYGCINAHGSILPRWRGAAPIQRAIMSGDTVTGVTAMYMEKGLDTGDMICAEEVAIADDDNFGTLHDKLADAACRVIPQAIELIVSGAVAPVKQDDSAATYASKITKDECLVDFTLPAEEICRKIRGLSPFPLAFTRLPSGKLMKIVSAHIESDMSKFSGMNAAIGAVISTDDGISVVGTDGVIVLDTVVPEGKGKMSAADFVRGRGISVGDRLGAE